MDRSKYRHKNLTLPMKTKSDIGNTKLAYLLSQKPLPSSITLSHSFFFNIASAAVV